MFSSKERLLSTSEVLKTLKIPRHRLIYLFESRKLDKNDFIRLDNGQTLFRESDIPKIKEALFSVGGVK